MDLNELKERVRNKKRIKYLFFWGHRQRPEGQLSACCFSQWYPAPFVVNGDRYPTAEHYMMAEKAKLFEDAEMRQEILVAKSPGKAKALGRRVRRFEETLWVENRFGIVVDANFAKFGQNVALHSFLLNTGDKVLVEASPHDRIWGIGLGAEDPRACHPHQWLGLNLLGFALMEVRERLRC